MDTFVEDIILKSSSAEVYGYQSKEFIFMEGERPQYYFQIIEGEVKLSNYGEDGKEIIQDILEEGDSFGEFMLFMDKVYPVNAIAITNCRILKIDKSKFMSMMERNPGIYEKMISSISNAMYFKFVMGQVISSQNPASKLIVLLDYMKSLQKNTERFSFKVPLTRQQMASLTGLCVETTIRTIKNMEKEKIIKICNRKIFY